MNIRVAIQLASSHRKTSTIIYYHVNQILQQNVLSCQLDFATYFHVNQFVQQTLLSCQLDFATECTIISIRFCNRMYFHFNQFLQQNVLSCQFVFATECTVISKCFWNIIYYHVNNVLKHYTSYSYASCFFKASHCIS